MAKTKVVKIEITYDDGSVLYAEGEDANKIVSWQASCETLAAVHGAKYSGPFMKERISGNSQHA